jgi:GT2 family glycosyltransferase
MGGDYVFISTNDLEFDITCIYQLVKIAEKDTSIGIVGPVAYHLDQREVIAYAPAAKIKSWIFSTTQGIYPKESGYAKEFDYIPGNMLFRLEMVKNVGLMDERLFMYYEEIDYCLRAKKAGYKIAVSLEAKIYHKMDDKTHGKLNTYFMVRNEPVVKLRYMPKIFIFPYLFFFILRKMSSLFYAFFRGVVKGKWIDFYLRYYGIRDFFLGKLGQGSLKKIIEKDEKENF